MKGLVDEAEARGAISKTGKATARAAGRVAGPKSQLEVLFEQVAGRSVVAENGIVANLSQANLSQANRNMSVVYGTCH